MNIVEQVRKDLKMHVDLEYRKGCQRFFREKVKVLGVRAKNARTIAKKHFGQAKALEKREIFALCEGLLKSNYLEETTIALDWAYRLKMDYEKEDFFVFEKWLERHVSNWASCDDLCTHVFGEFILQYPEFIPKTKKWAKSSNLWVRRGAAVALIPSVRQKKHLKEAFGICDILLLDKEDLVQKGCGWLLKEAGNRQQKKVFGYVMGHRHTMPRTALRYAIEKMPPALKKKAMQK